MTWRHGRAWHEVCLNCGHKKQDHGPPPDTRCHKAYCPCHWFKTTFL